MTAVRRREGYTAISFLAAFYNLLLSVNAPSIRLRSYANPWYRVQGRFVLVRNSIRRHERRDRGQ